MRGQRAGAGHQGTRIAVMPGVTLSSLSADCTSMPLIAMAAPYGSCSGGAILRASDGAVRLSQITLVAGQHAALGGDVSGSAAYGLWLQRTHAAVLEDVSVRGASQSGIVTEGAMLMRWTGVYAQYNARGIMLIGANGSLLHGVSAAVNSGDGIVITTRPGALATGEVTLLGTVVEANAGHGLWWRTVYGGGAFGLRAEANSGDGVRIESSDLVSLRDARVIVGQPYQHPTVPGESLYHGVALYSCRGCVVEHVATNGSGGAQNVWVEGAAPFTRVSDVVYWGGSVSGPLEYAGASSWVRVAWHDPVSGMT